MIHVNAVVLDSAPLLGSYSSVLEAELFDCVEYAYCGWHLVHEHLDTTSPFEVAVDTLDVGVKGAEVHRGRRVLQYESCDDHVECDGTDALSLEDEVPCELKSSLVKVGFARGLGLVGTEVVLEIDGLTECHVNLADSLARLRLDHTTQI